jgi:hypothetical protein
MAAMGARCMMLLRLLLPLASVFFCTPTRKRISPSHKCSDFNSDKQNALLQWMV